MNFSTLIGIFVKNLVLKLPKTLRAVAKEITEIKLTYFNLVAALLFLNKLNMIK